MNKLTYRQLKRRKEFHCIKLIGEKLEKKDFEKNNINYKPIYHFDEIGNIIGIETGWVKKTYWSDIWYMFDLLEWSRQKRYTL